QRRAPLGGCRRGAAGERGDPPVDDVDASARVEEDVLWLEVAVDELPRVRGVERRRDGRGDRERTPPPEPAIGDAPGGRVAFEELQGDEREVARFVDPSVEGARDRGALDRFERVDLLDPGGAARVAAAGPARDARRDAQELERAGGADGPPFDLLLGL